MKKSLDITKLRYSEPNFLSPLTLRKSRFHCTTDKVLTRYVVGGKSHACTVLCPLHKNRKKLLADIVF